MLLNLYSIRVFVLLAVFFPLFIQAAPKNTSVNFFRGASQDSGYYPGEHLDARTGSLYWEITDFTIPGQGGLSIEIVRSFNKNGPERLALGNWELEIPRVTLEMDRAAYKYTKKGHTLCAFGHQLAANGKGMQLRIPNQRTRDLLIRDASSPHPERAKYVTNDHWIAYCTNRRLNHRYLYKNYVTAFVVESPDGKKYIMDYISQDESGLNPRATFYASEVTDRNGNWLKYEYGYSAIEKRDDDGTEEYRYYQAKPSLQKLSANDGREVFFSYKYARPTFEQPYLLPRITQITANNTSWTYSARYNSNLGLNELAKVTLPDASQWFYDYGNVIGLTLKKVVTPTNAEIAYGYRRISSRYFEGKGGLNAFDVAAIAERTIKGPYLSETKWSYNYSVDSASQESVTRVNWANQRQVEYRFQRGNMTDWNLGLPTLTKIIDLTQGLTIREEHWQWQKPTPVGSQWVKSVYHMPAVEHPHLLTKHEVDGHVTTFSDFDDFGYPRKQEEQGTRRREYTYSYHSSDTPWMLGLRKSESLEGIGSKLFEYDQKGNILSSNQYGQVTYFDYDDFGNLSEKRWLKDGIQLQETYEDYYRGRPKLVKRPGSVVERQTLSKWGLPTTKVDARGHATEYQYDAINRIKEVKPPIQAQTSYSYPDKRTSIIKTGKYEERRYKDVLGHEVLKRSVDLLTGEQHEQKSEYDILGRKSFESQRSYERHETKGVKTEYDVINRPIEIINTADGSKIRHCYKECALPDSVQVSSSNYEVITDARGYKRVLEYDTYGNPDQKHLIAIHEQVKQSPNEYRVTRIKRNLLGEVLEIQQGSVNRAFSYNQQQRLATEYHPEVGLIEYGYDEVGNRVLKRAGGVETRYYYDGLNRLVKTEYEDNLVQTRQYDGNGNLISLTQTSEDKETQWHYQYNAKDQLISETLAYEGKTYRLDYSYNSQGQRETELLLGDKSIGYHYDAFGRVTSIDNLINKVNYYPNGGVKEIHYPDGGLRQIHQNAQLLPSQIQYVATSQMALDIGYQYDTNGNLKSASNSLLPAENLALTYDGINRLIQADGLWGLGHLVYDEQDNIKSYQLGSEFKNYIYDAQNRLAQVETSTFSPVLTISSASVEKMAYDDFGNLASKNNTKYHFNLANQMVSAETDEQHSFVYDGAGHRVEKLTGEKKENSLYDQSGTLRVKITDEGAEYYVRLKNETIAKLKKDEIIYYQNDLLGSPKLAINQAGEIKWRQDYSPYGLELLETTDTGSVGYTGHQHDKALGLTYMKARYFNPSIGRFLSIDPAAPVAKTPASFNRYSYAANNPYKYVDPDGEHPVVLGIMAISWAVGAASTAIETYGTYRETGSYKEAGWTASKGIVGTALTAAGLGVAMKGVSAVNIAVSTGLITGTSSAIGVFSVGGSTKDMALSFLVGYGTGFVATMSRKSSRMAFEMLNSGSMSAFANYFSQEANSKIEGERSDINYGSVAGSFIGGMLSARAAYGQGGTALDQALGFGRSTALNTTAGIIGDRLGDKQE